MKYDIFLQHLVTLPHFTKETVRQVSASLDIASETADVYVSRYLARKELISLKKGMYVTADFFEKHRNDVAYTFYVANVLRQPSYVSSWMALQYYDLTTEAIREVTSVTPKRTRSHANKAGNFFYHSIKKELFSGFTRVTGEFDFFIATPAKALFDLLYFKTNELRSLPYNEVAGLVEELRIDFDEMDTEERNHFWELMRKYTK